jgi:hypothetical protein
MLFACVLHAILSVRECATICFELVGVVPGMVSSRHGWVNHANTLCNEVLQYLGF